MEGLELLSFQMISFNGSARSCFVEAIQAAKEGDFERAEQTMAEGEEQFVEGHRVHAQLIQQEAQNGATQVNLLLIHAEDQMMSAEVLKIMATELIDIHKKIQ
ncbi:PTS lactose/cellobiose transporter subunit IIA [Erysipelothrix rhusiopathiae]|uniref:PTS lactose/cellobiose transporter subunit IIA n=1 Tax=Erysipelothrix rhusiopathiae TaxID=1648 RepID=UPI002B2460D6|nr:PTS lactose/cellobiose transporter subunit IIA [Erysipelothrix rhusiopathiae]WRB93757.1 PTS lactose/cellobiose transporter subunit IIA [Erysipelothrix rhusiopathiae]